jgi:hypothetical protein
MSTPEQPARPIDTEEVRRWLAEQLARAPEPTDLMAASLFRVLSSIAARRPQESPSEPPSGTRAPPDNPATGDPP